MKKNLIFCYILVAVAAVTATEYCNMSCTVNGTEIKHIACGHDQKFGPLCPEDVRMITLTEADKDLFIHQYNAFRDFVAGGGNSSDDYKPACRMATVQWDDVLAEHAALNVKGCTEWFDNCHTTDNFRSSGQFVTGYYKLVESGTDASIDTTVMIAVETTNKNAYGDTIADRNIRLGCAIASASSNKTFSKRHVNKFWTVCNFSTDVQDRESTYERCKSPAEKCKNKPVDPYPNLCAKGEAYE